MSAEPFIDQFHDPAVTSAKAADLSPAAKIDRRARLLELVRQDGKQRHATEELLTRDITPMEEQALISRAHASLGHLPPDHQIAAKIRPARLGLGPINLIRRARPTRPA